MLRNPRNVTNQEIPGNNASLATNTAAAKWMVASEFTELRELRGTQTFLKNDFELHIQNKDANGPLQTKTYRTQLQQRYSI